MAVCESAIVTLEEMGVKAVAQGTDILLDESSGMDVLGHELAHVVQQAQGRVEGGFPVVEHASLEQEADVMGARVASGLTAQAGPQNGLGGEPMAIAPMSEASAPAQCKSRQEKKRPRKQLSHNSSRCQAPSSVFQRMCQGSCPRRPFNRMILWQTTLTRMTMTIWHTVGL